MRFDEVWIDDEQLNRLADLVKSTAHLDGEVVEIGVWQGLSTITLMNAIAPACVHAVDHWQGDSSIGKGIDPQWAASRDNYGIFLNNVREGTSGNVVVHKMGWREFVADFKLPIRFLHLDATHTADEVSDNIAALLPLAVPRAIFAGDDLHWPEVAEGVSRQFGTNFRSAGHLWWKVLS